MKSKIFKLFFLSFLIPSLGTSEELTTKYWSPWSALPLEHRYRFTHRHVEFPTELIIEWNGFCNDILEARIQPINKDANNFVCNCMMDNYRYFNTDDEYEYERTHRVKGSKWEHVERGPDDPSPVPLFGKYFYQCFKKRLAIISSLGEK